MYKWYLPTLSELMAPELAAGNTALGKLGFVAQQQVRAEREWSGAIAALNLLLQRYIQPAAQSKTNGCSPLIQGVLLSGPVPVVESPDLLARLSTWTFTTHPLGPDAWMPLHLLPTSAQQTFKSPTGNTSLALMPNDPLATEQFCLVLTAHFGLVMVLGEDASGAPAFLFSFDPEVVLQSWQALRGRMLFTSPEHLPQIDYLLEKYTPVVPDFRLVTEFSRLMLASLPLVETDTVIAPATNGHGSSVMGMAAPTVAVEKQVSDSQFATPRSNGTRPATVKKCSSVSSEIATAAEVAARELGRSEQGQAADKETAKEGFDSELLQAIAHEVRTPLTTIRTLTRLLLKRKDLSPDVLKRLEVIDQECTDQIDRFNLFFKAVEVAKAPKQPLSPLAPISLAQIFQQTVPRWKQQASQRNLTLDVALPQKLPMVVTDPTMLDQVLTGLIDRIIHTLAPGSHIQVQVTLAGHQLKLQFESQSQTGEVGRQAGLSPLKALGQLLMFQPETGNLSLNLAVTKTLFQALGGKMTVKQRPQQGEVLTVFLPLETRSDRA